MARLSVKWGGSLRAAKSKPVTWFIVLGCVLAIPRVRPTQTMLYQIFRYDFDRVVTLPETGEWELWTESLAMDNSAVIRRKVWWWPWSVDFLRVSYSSHDVSGSGLRITEGPGGVIVGHDIPYGETIVVLTPADMTRISIFGSLTVWDGERLLLWTPFSLIEPGIAFVIAWWLSRKRRRDSLEAAHE